MARFQLRGTSRIFYAERVKSPMQVETYLAGWVTAGVGTWHVIDPTPGMKGAVVEDPEFRRDYEPLDADAQKSLDMGAPGTTSRGPSPAVVPPVYSAAQNLSPAQVAAERAAGR